MTSPPQQHTCYTCRVAFRDFELQRDHYKGDWHKYNLMRKVAEMPPLTIELFHEREAQKTSSDKQEENEKENYCSTCKKSFGNKKAYENHLHSKRHEDNLLKPKPKRTPSSKMNSKVRNSVSNSTTEEATNEEDMESLDTDSEVEEVDSDEWNDWSEFSGKPILFTECLFCSRVNETMEDSLRHMTKKHSFFIPDIEYIVDMKAMLTYLGCKVGQGNMCLWCNEHGRQFHSTQATQQHMVDKGHCKVLHEGETLLEFEDFYDYSKSYHEQEDEEEVEIPVIEDDDYELVLPSGSVIGHRALFRYYKQRLQPIAVTKQKSRPNYLTHLLAEYRALGWKEGTAAAIKRKAKDLHYMKKFQAKQYMKMGVKANKLHVNRPQVMF